MRITQCVSYRFAMPKAPEQPQVWEHADDLREIRGGMSVDAAARRVGVVRQTWSGWEDGVTPRYDHLVAIVEAFGCPAEKVGLVAPRGYELVPAEWIRSQHDDLKHMLQLIHDQLGIIQP